jgi:hypothetical protein
MLPVVREALRSVDPDLPLLQPQPLPRASRGRSPIASSR